MSYNEPINALRRRNQEALGKLAAAHSGTVKQSTVISKNDLSGGSWSAGADQEEEVARRIDGLKEKGWFVLHDVPVSGGSVDHLLIGPSGIFAVNTRMHIGAAIETQRDATVHVNGEVFQYGPEAIRQAETISQTLTNAVGFQVSAFGVLVLLNGASGVGSVRTRYVFKKLGLLRYSDIATMFTSSNRVLDVIQAGIVYETARRLSTWQSA